MRRSAWLILIATTVLVAGGATWTVLQRERATHADDARVRFFPGLAGRVNDVTQIEISGPKGAFHVRSVKDAAGQARWVMAEKSDYPAKIDKVKKTVTAMAEIAGTEPRTDTPALYDKIGVGEPGKPDSDAVRIRVLDGKDAILADLITGKFKTRESGNRAAEIYVRRPDAARAWLAEARIDAVGDPLEWIDHEILRLARTRVAEAVTTQPDKSRARVYRDDLKATDFKLDKVPNGYHAASQVDVNGIGGGLDYVTFDDVRKAAGLDLGQAVVTEVRTFDGVVLTIRVVQNDGKSWAVIGASVDAARAKTRPADDKEVLLSADAVEKEVAELNGRLDGWAFQLPDFRAKDWTRKLADLVEKDEDKKDDKKGGK